MTARQPVRIAHLSGPNATIQNTPPLVTSNKARRKRDLPLLQNPDGSVARFDALRPQRLAAPAKVYVEQFSAHPLERDAAELYGQPDGYVDERGVFHKDRSSPTDKPVYEIELSPEDGLYPLPYMAVQADGQPWDEECAFPGAPADKARQIFFPDGSRSFEDIDRLSVRPNGLANPISSLATVDFYRVLPPGGYTKGLSASLRTDVGEGDIAPEVRGRHFFPYKPRHIATRPPRPTLARVTNMTQAIMSSGKYLGAIFTQGSPAIEETAYWLSLLIDTTLPICGNSAQRPQGEVSNDGPKNIIDSVAYIDSRVWADEQGRNRAGVVVIQEQRAFAAREVTKVDARPGGYAATGGHGGILGGVNHVGRAVLQYVPAYKHTYLSEVNVSRLPEKVLAVRRADNRLERIEIAVKDANGEIMPDAIPSVSIIKDGGYTDEDFDGDPARELDIKHLIERKLGLGRLTGLITEGQVPYGTMTSAIRQKAIEQAVTSGIPVVRVGRGAPEGFAEPSPLYISGSNLTAIKARLLLMACLMKFGSLPPAKNPADPTAHEKSELEAAVAAYQSVFNTH
jgi:L-asparaginase/Glu-tRNA(Gln) amidotransferase subunit D